MWWKLFKAEIYKIVGHRWATGCLMWIFPAFALVGIGLLMLGVTLSSEFRQNMGTGPLPQWNEQAIAVWNYPNNPVGRLILAGFSAVFLAGEYQWSTWKNIVPRSYRIPLIVVKFIAIGMFVLFTFNLTALIWSVGMGMVVEAGGYDYGPALSGDVLQAFLEDYNLQMLITFISTIIAVGYVTLAAMLTRSILGSVITGVLMTFIEGGSIVGLALIAWVLDWVEILNLYRLTPTYNLLNLTSWLVDGKGMGFEIEEGIPTMDSLAFSIAVLSIWMFGLIAAASFLFQRRNLTE